MTWLGSNPLNDDVASDSYVTHAGGAMHQQALMNQSPFFNFETFFLPKTVKELFEYSAHAASTNSVINPAIEKLAEYPITDFVFTPKLPAVIDDEAEKEFADSKKELVDTWQNIFKNLQAKEFAMKCSMDYQVYGNVFVYVYQPFDRMLVCKSCNYAARAKSSKWEWDRAALKFRMHCVRCGTKGHAKVKDVLLKDASKVHLSAFYPGNFDIDFDPYSGECDFYYTVPLDQLDKIRKGNRLRLLNTPMDVIEAARTSKNGRAAPKIRFRKSNLYHLPRSSYNLPGPETRWGTPNTISVLRDVFYLNMMRRAQLALLLEHILPLRFVFPAADTSPNSTTPVDLLDWRKKIEGEIRKWKRDPLYMMVSPIPLGHDQMGGQGKALMLYPEMEQTQNNIMNGLNVPIEFVRGGLQYTGTSVSLRMLENSLLNQVNGITRMFQWIISKISEITGLEEVTVAFKKFKMADDIQQRQLAFTYWQAGLLSGETFGQHNDFDYDVEQQLRSAENIEKAKADAKAATEAAAFAQVIQARIMAAQPPQAAYTQPTIPNPQLEQIYEGFTKLKPNEAVAAMEQINEQNPTLGRQLQTRSQTDPAATGAAVQDLAALDPQTRAERLGQMHAENPMATAIINRMLEGFGVSGVYGPTPGDDAQGGGKGSPSKTTKAAPDQKPPRRQGGSPI